MKYSESGKFSSYVGKTGFYMVVVLCLLGIAAAAWFAVTRYDGFDNIKDNSSKQESILNSPDSSYESITQTPSSAPEQPSESVANSVSDVPYESSSVPTEPVEEKRSFVLPVQGNVSKGFSDSALQYSETYKDMRLHDAVDILCSEGTDVHAVGKGNVTSVEESETYGRIIMIDHGDGIIIRYCGVASVNVSAGDEVSAGTVIGTSGTVPCESADEPHIHIEAVVEGKIVSPLEALGLK